MVRNAELAVEVCTRGISWPGAGNNDGGADSLEKTKHVISDQLY